MKANKREAGVIIQALSAGVVPRVGLQHVAVGRQDEILALEKSLNFIKDGGAAVRFVVGRYGSGKSFLIQLARNHALSRKFIVADADLTPTRRLHGTDGQSLALYRELTRRLSTQSRPEGGALESIIDRWIQGIQHAVASEDSLKPGDDAFERAMGRRIGQTLMEMQELVHGFDFAQVVTAYYDGFVRGDEDRRANAIRWLRGEFETKTEAKKVLGIGSIIDDSNWYDYLKVIARFAREIGYSGLLICIDEMVNLYKISNAISRKNNYEHVLSILNDCLQGGAQNIGFLFGGTPESVDDARRGLFSYEALRSRLSSGAYETADRRDLSSPILRLPQLANEEIFVLLQRVRDLHVLYEPAARPISDDGIKAIMTAALSRAGAETFATPRELVRNFIQISNLIAQDPAQTWQALLGDFSFTQAQPDEDTLVEPDQTEPESLQQAPAKPATSNIEDDPLARFRTLKL